MIRAVLILLSLWAAVPAVAQTLGALARIEPDGSRIVETEAGVDIVLALSQPVPFRVFTLDDPMRLVVDFREVAFDGLGPAFGTGPIVTGIETGVATSPGWSRMVLTLAEPLAPRIAAMQTDAVTGQAVVTLQLSLVSADAFAADAGPPPGLTGAVLPVVTPAAPDAVPERLVVVLDPGHGGVDPGAINGNHNEADLMLSFARDLREVLRRTGAVDVILTRDSDVFVPLPTRVTLARAAGADLFVSLHADALAEGRAQGATVYTLAETASDAATAALAEQHDRADLLEGIDLSGTDDTIAAVLIDLARTETAPRGRAFAELLVEAIAEEGLALHSRPMGEGAFSVLKAADFPSILLEIGYLSAGGDLDNILDPEWRARMQTAISNAILSWAEADSALADLMRQ